MTEKKAKPKAGRASRRSTSGKPAPKVVKVAGAEALNEGLGTADWRERTLAHVRELILEADPQMIEERKWRKPSNGMAGVPVWSHGGIVCTGETYQTAVKLTFAKGASLPDPARLFNAGLEGGTRRAIDIHEGEEVDAAAFQALIKAAVAQNCSTGKEVSRDAKRPKSSAAKPAKLLSGGNPQIAKGYGDAPVQDYIAAMPGWKRDVGRRLDALIVRSVPDVQKAVKWNSPFYGIEGQGWFLGIHCFTNYIKVAFFRGASLRPIPPGKSKQKDVRYLDIREDDELDEAQLADWIKQASRLPGERM